MEQHSNLQTISFEALVQAIAEQLLAHNLYLAVAESCTGGWLAQALTAIPGSSTWFERGFVTYSNASKQEMLGVHANTLESYGAVSPQVVKEMVQGAILHSHAQVAVAVTGIAGPAGGTPEKPVGTVWFGFVGPKFSPQTTQQIFVGDRNQIRGQAVEFALTSLLKLLSSV
jgi:nicotinamide-nucleotide amidase